MQFEKCAGCGWDIGTGEGERSCSWGECSYLPEELDVYCEQCRFNYSASRAIQPVMIR
jgi:hypothetical protein